MSTITLLEESAHWAVAAKPFALLAALLGVWALPSEAAQSSAQFGVTINLQTNSNAGSCQSSNIGMFGAIQTVSCTTGARTNFPGSTASLPAIQDGPRYLYEVYRGEELLGIVDSYSGTGTYVSWRVFKLNNQDYLERTEHW